MTDPSPEHQTLLDDQTVLLCEVGSTLYGTNIEGQDDLDQMGVFIPSFDEVVGFKTRDHSIYRTQPEGVRSGHGDIDRTLYSLRRFLGLALKSNPSILVALFVPPERCPIYTPLGSELQSMAEHLISKQVFNPYYKYALNQLDRLEKSYAGGSPGHMAKRPELIEAHGFDTKYAMHVYRLAVQGVEILKTGQVTLPMPEHDREIAQLIRRGEFTFERTRSIIQGALGAMTHAVEISPLPEKPDVEYVEDWMIDAHAFFWSE
jgi:predicted nucleotidyltransferase